MAFRGDIALITGAASGMGQLAAWRLAAEGITVAALDVDEDGLDQTSAKAPSIRAFPCDVSDWERVGEVVSKVEANLGPIDRVVSAAAIAPTERLLDQPVEAIRRMTEINYLGSVYVAKATLPAMLERGRGDWIQFASLAGWVPALYFGAYSATKHAVVAFSEILYHENKDRGVRMACVCPPIVDTPLLSQVGQSAGALMEASGQIQPEQVLDAIELSLDKGEFFVFPGKGTRTVQRVRRFVPDALWKGFHDIEAGKGAGPLSFLGASK
jgi:NAD(P)-dependent dehydrogenase (short-subunit alcohol dehydrogenase family)